MSGSRANADAKPARSLPLPLLTDSEWKHVVHVLKFSPQQVRIVELILQGKKHKQIAMELVLSESTVQTYLGRIFHRLGVGDRTELILHIFAASRDGYCDEQVS